MNTVRQLFKILKSCKVFSINKLKFVSNFLYNMLFSFPLIVLIINQSFGFVMKLYDLVLEKQLLFCNLSAIAKWQPEKTRYPVKEYVSYKTKILKIL